jgi:hypothetical protein
LPGSALRSNVTRGEAFAGRELRGLDAPLDHSPLAVDQFQLHQARQELHMVQPLGGTLAGQLFVLAQEGRQLQRLQIREQDLRCRGHAASPDSSDM